MGARAARCCDGVAAGSDTGHERSRGQASHEPSANGLHDCEAPHAPHARREPPRAPTQAEQASARAHIDTCAVAFVTMLPRCYTRLYTVCAPLRIYVCAPRTRHVPMCAKRYGNSIYCFRVRCSVIPQFGSGTRETADTHHTVNTHRQS